MNNVLSLIQAARKSPNPHPELYSEHMLAELLALHGEMIEQLRLERLASTCSVDFLTDLIAQHEKTAGLLRAKLENYEAEIGGETMPQPPPTRAPRRPRPLPHDSLRSSLRRCRAA